MRALVLYSTSRIALFLVVLVVVHLVGAPGLVALALALLISGAASFFLLSGQRDALSAALTERASRARTRLDDAAASEDGDEEMAPAVPGEERDERPHDGPRGDVAR